MVQLFCFTGSKSSLIIVNHRAPLTVLVRNVHVAYFLRVVAVPQSSPLAQTYVECIAHSMLLWDRSVPGLS